MITGKTRGKQEMMNKEKQVKTMYLKTILIPKLTNSLVNLVKHFSHMIIIKDSSYDYIFASILKKIYHDMRT